ncbi:aquaporin [Atractiella rhizophila]|nr:aquaporin [Atractiella rhizophila]
MSRSQPGSRPRTPDLGAVDPEYRSHPLLPALVDSRNRSHQDIPHHHHHHKHSRDEPAHVSQPYGKEENVRYVLVTPEMLREIVNQTASSAVPPIKLSAQDEADVKTSGLKETEHVESAKPPLHDGTLTHPPILKNKLSRPDTTSSEEDEAEAALEFENRWGSWRHTMREAFAEYLGTCMLLLFGNGVNMQVFLSTNAGVAGSQAGSYLSVNFGWGIGVLTGVYVSGGISGGHINPAVTFALAIWRGFPWKKVPVYWLSQILGAMTGSALVYLNYVNAINIYEGGPNVRTFLGENATAKYLSTYPAAWIPGISAFFDEVLGTAILLIVVFAISDRNNSPPPDGMNPVILMWLVVGIGACFGLQTAYGINPARDLGPRFVTWFVGYGRGVWTFRDWYWLWTPVLGPLVGANVGALAYDLLIYTGDESPVNKAWKWGYLRFWKKKSTIPDSTRPAGKVSWKEEEKV